MAVRTMRARLEMDGEKQYKEALSELNKGNQVLGSEMKKLQAQYKGNTDSTEFLTKKGELLEKQLLQQKDKVQTLRDALNQAAQKYGESSEKTREWQIKLNNAEAAQYNLENAIDENNAALQGEDETMQGLGDTVGELAKKLGIKLPDSATKALNGMQGLSAGTVAAMGAAVAGVTALWEAVKKLHETTLEAAHDADELITESMTTGLSTRTIQQLKYAENLIDVSYSTITGSLTKLTKNMAAARDGYAALAESFGKLGVSITNADGSLRSAEEVFYDTIDALGGMENGTERDAVAMEVLGRSAQELNPLILQGSKALRELGAEAEKTGYVLDESQTKKLGEVDDAYQRMELQIEATKKQLAAEFAPASKEVMESFTQLVQTAGDALAKSGLVRGVGELVQYSTALLQPLGALLGLSPELTNKLKPLYTVIHSIAGALAYLADVGNAAVGVLQALTIVGWKQGTTRLNTALGLNAKYGMYSNIQKWDGTAAAYDEWRSSSLSGYASQDYGYDSRTGQYYDIATGNYIYSYNAGGTDNWRGGLTWVGESGPELVRLPAGSQIYSNQESRGAGGDVYIEQLVLDAKSIKELNDVYALLSSAAILKRMKG